MMLCLVVENSYQMVGMEPLESKMGVRKQEEWRENGDGTGLGANEGMASFHGDYKGAVRLN